MKLLNRTPFYSALLAMIVSGATQLVLISDAYAGAGLRINPTRVLLEGRKRGAEVNLSNTGDQAATFRISFKNMRMTDDGDYEDITEPDPGQMFADEMIRYSPRQITLEPNSNQTVRLLLRKPRGLEPGEYRSHFQLLSVPEADATQDIEALQGEENALAVGVKQIYGISIPVIVRHGKLDATIAISDTKFVEPKVKDGERKLAVRLDREGKRSVYGDIDVFLKRTGQDDVRIGLVRGINVFTPNRLRWVNVPIAVPDGIELNAGELHIVFRKSPDDGGDVLDEHTVPLL